MQGLSVSSFFGHAWYVKGGEGALDLLYGSTSVSLIRGNSEPS